MFDRFSGSSGELSYITIALDLLIVLTNLVIVWADVLYCQKILHNLQKTSGKATPAPKSNSMMQMFNSRSVIDMNSS